MVNGERLLKTPRPDDPFEGKVIGDYQLRHRVGSGGMSRVYLAEDTRTGERVALKFLRSAFVNLPGFVRRFEREATALERLDHINCLSVFGHGVVNEIPYLVIEYVGGQTLAELIHKGPVSPALAIDISQQILAGLQHAHTRAVIHRDLKPANVMLVETTSPQDVVKIMDFGTAQILDGGELSVQGGTDVGTPWYMAPEQASGQSTDGRADLYAMGVILFEMLAGERPFRAENPFRVLQMHLSSPIPSPRALRPEIGLSPEIEGVIVRAMQKKPTKRFIDAEAFSAALRELPEWRSRRSSERVELSAESHGRPPSPREPTPPAEEAPAPPRRSWATVLWLLVLALLTTSGLLMYLLFFRR
ncbi:MAG: serine/threonine protein kinase [Deltaproteobacteria bacterium]|nr:serine/threonine protein kinase [Deltaproteobacteria bacterium]